MVSVCCREHNFSRTFSSAQAFGEGVYFATEAAYSANPRYSKPNHAGQQFMILTKVLCDLPDELLLACERLGLAARSKRTLALHKTLSASTESFRGSPKNEKVEEEWTW